MSTKQFTAKVFRWLAQVNGDCELPPSAAKIAIGLAAYFNEGQGGMAWPGFETLADDTCLSKSVVVSVLRKMAERGHLKTEAGRPGRGHSSHYWMIEKGREADLFEPGKRSAAPPRKGRLAARKGRLADLNLSKNHRIHRAAYAAPVEGERVALARCASGSVGPPADAGPPDEDYEELRAVWARPWVEDERADRNAFAMACREVAPGVILAAARTWVAAADAPRFLQPLAKWLNGRGYEHDPPTRPKASPHRSAHRTGGKPDLARMMLAAGRM